MGNPYNFGAASSELFELTDYICAEFLKKPKLPGHRVSGKHHKTIQEIADAGDEKSITPRLHQDKLGENPTTSYVLDIKSFGRGLDGPHRDATLPRRRNLAAVSRCRGDAVMHTASEYRACGELPKKPRAISPLERNATDPCRFPNCQPTNLACHSSVILRVKVLNVFAEPRDQSDGKVGMPVGSGIRVKVTLSSVASAATSN